MGKYFIVFLGLISGVGTIPCLLYLIWASMQEQQEAIEDEKKRQWAKEMEKRGF